MNARNSPLGTSRLTPCNTSIRSLPRVKYLWTFLIVTRVSMKPLLLLDDNRQTLSELRRRRDHHAIATFQTGDDFEPIAVGAGGLNRPSFDRVLPHHERVARPVLLAHRALGHERDRLLRGWGLVVRASEERHLDAHVREDPRIELGEGDPNEHRRLLPIGRRYRRDDVA